MYRLYAERSPNVFKAAICLAELGVEWDCAWIDVCRGDQHGQDFLALNPNGRIPVLVDLAPTDGGPPQTVWESGAILHYLAEKHGVFLPSAPRARTQAMIWLFWQMASLGPMTGQHAHFSQYNLPEPYALKRYATEVSRLHGVLDGQLIGRDWIADEYSIADMACFPWIRTHEYLKLDLTPYPHLSAWYARMGTRDGVVAGYDRINALPASTATLEERFEAMKPEVGARAQAEARRALVSP